MFEVQAVKEIPSHSPVAVALGIYAHMWTRHRREAVERLDGLTGRQAQAAISRPPASGREWVILPSTDIKSDTGGEFEKEQAANRGLAVG